MVDSTMVQKLNRDVTILRRDVTQIKGVLSNLLRDSEGEYRQQYVRKIETRSRVKPSHRFAGRALFLKHVRG